MTDPQATRTTPKQGEEIRQWCDAHRDTWPGVVAFVEAPTSTSITASDLHKIDRPPDAVALIRIGHEANNVNHPARWVRFQHAKIMVGGSKAPWPPPAGADPLQVLDGALLHWPSVGRAVDDDRSAVLRLGDAYQLVCGGLYRGETWAKQEIVPALLHAVDSMCMGWRRRPWGRALKLPPHPRLGDGDPKRPRGRWAYQPGYTYEVDFLSDAETWWLEALSRIPGGDADRFRKRLELRALRREFDERRKLSIDLTEAWRGVEDVKSLPAGLRRIENLLHRHGATLRDLPATTVAEQLITGAIELALQDRDDEVVRVLSEHFHDLAPPGLAEAMRRSGARVDFVPAEGTGLSEEVLSGFVDPKGELARHMKHPPAPTPPGADLGAELWGGPAGASGLCRRIAAMVGLEFNQGEFLMESEFTEDALGRTATDAPAAKSGEHPLRYPFQELRALLVAYVDAKPEPTIASDTHVAQAAWRAAHEQHRCSFPSGKAFPYGGVIVQRPAPPPPPPPILSPPRADILALIEWMTLPLIRFDPGVCLSWDMLIEHARKAAITEPFTPEANPQDELVDLDQAAAWVKRRKRTVEKLKEQGKLPEPDVRAKKRGQKHLWKWRSIRPALEAEYNMKLPETLPRSFR